jgi:hypothetical protein
VTWRNVSTVALAFAAPGPVETTGAVEVSVRPGMGARWPFAEGWALEARAGVELRPNRLRVTLPPPYAAGEHAVDPGPITPFAELAVAAQIF